MLSETRSRFSLVALAAIFAVALGAAGCAPMAEPTPETAPPAVAQPSPTPAAQASPTPAAQASPTPVAQATATPTAAPAAAQQQRQVDMINISFQPQEITVESGTTVLWTNEDSFPHTVTSGIRDNPSGLFDSGNVSAGGTFSFTFQEQGTIEYFCRIHPGMRGTVIVQD